MHPAAARDMSSLLGAPMRTGVAHDVPRVGAGVRDGLVDALPLADPMASTAFSHTSLELLGAASLSTSASCFVKTATKINTRRSQQLVQA